MTSRNRRLLVLGAVSAVGALAPTLRAYAQTWPAQPIRIVVPFGAGGVADLTARVVAQRLSQSLGQPVIIDNRPGAGGVVASDVVAKAAPDGYTLLLMSNASAVSANLFKTLPFDVMRDLAPISTLATFELGLLARSDARFRNAAELLAYARANPGKLNIGSINVGSTQHLAAELLKIQAKVDLQVVPFNGSPAVLTALRGGQIDAAVEILAPVMAQVTSGALRVLAVTSEKRSPALPDVPTMIESSIPGYAVTSWNALAAPARTPAPVIARLNRDIGAALADAEVLKKLRALYVTPGASSPEKARELLASEVTRWGEVITRAGIAKQ
ncbi:tripartite tricarboxylate transporter substrate binding protein [Variovorax sp. J22G21]|uniref:Bug family tripartite tricarboxylate transporter substrate binding protein n=1 Tax=Variovorax fucosicus TaxID=3053517 RepID=UPI00257762B6|nr:MULTISPECIES: tripartite tricarboxylate transporter substrate binding protein [unclassified Variovorax]MDM0037703.1 tripartite tricarboxylate transporter substrate binding protein [Variovorax sp. J22R193]MDM0056628.1 tripartite tricarboxylate transporter substrate binding protein [Variovorax sp. J22G47]MDM0062479.1 tripartite tricarboxylate transporter substrate binding protein [Variovorax sp. J22G21]